MFLDPRFARNLRCTSDKKFSTRVNCLLSSTQANIFPGMKRREILRCLSSLKMVTSSAFSSLQGLPS